MAKVANVGGERGLNVKSVYSMELAKVANLGGERGLCAKSVYSKELALKVKTVKWEGKWGE